ncbi:MAG: hypothetical protein J5938_01495, partial [Clostridia bacterium]|nr:hypothetical protein [Clostridia bacterium]
MGGLDEQLQSAGGRNTFAGGSVQLSLFPSETEQIHNIDEAESRDNRPFAFSIPDAVIDDFLRYGSNSDDARRFIVAEFMKEKPKEDHATYLQKMYHGGYGLNTDGGKYSAWYAEEGLRFSAGISAEYRSDAQVLSWTEAAERIDGMLMAGIFATNVEIAEALGTERRKIAETVWFLRRDLDDQAQVRYLISVADLGQYPADAAMERIAERISDPEFRHRLTDDLRTFIQDYAENRDLLRYSYHRPEELLASMEELDLPIRTFTTERTEMPAPSSFITEDEIAHTLGAGSQIAGGKERIARFFAEGHTQKEKTDFLKNESGIGG